MAGHGLAGWAEAPSDQGWRGKNRNGETLEAFAARKPPNVLWEADPRNQLPGYKRTRSGEETGGLDDFAKVEKLEGHPSSIIYK